MTVMSSLATFWPIRPEYTERPFRFRSASRPWPTDSWMSVPPASLDGHVAGVDSHRRGARQLIRRRVRCLVELAPLGDPACGPTGEGNEVVDVRDIAVRVGGPLALRDADAGALIDAADGVLDAAVVEDELQRLVPLPIELGPVATT